MSSWFEEIKNEFEEELTHRQMLIEMGMLTRREFEVWLQGYHQALPFQCSRKSGYCCSGNMSETQWKQLQEDYALWQAGKPFSNTEGDDWLIVKSNERSLSVAQLKTEFFECRHSLLQGIADLEPVPATIERSGMLIGMPYHPKTPQWLLFDCTELIHLFEKPGEALGNTYRFTAENGICLQVKIEQKGKTKNPETIVLEGKGYLTEYMMPLDHTLTLRYSFENTQRYPFPEVEFCFLSYEDLRFYYDSPRFQPYFTFLRAQSERAWQETQKLYVARYGN